MLSLNEKNLSLKENSEPCCSFLPKQLSLQYPVNETKPEIVSTLSEAEG